MVNNPDLFRSYTTLYYSVINTKTVNHSEKDRFDDRILQTFLTEKLTRGAIRSRNAEKLNFP